MYGCFVIVTNWFPFDEKVKQACYGFQVLPIIENREFVWFKGRLIIV